MKHKKAHRLKTIGKSSRGSGSLPENLEVCQKIWNSARKKSGSFRITFIVSI
jgi:hypothetical protein